MTGKKIHLISAILLIFCFLWSSNAYAQGPEGIVVIYPAVEEQEDSLALNVFFTIVDGAGQPVSDANIKSVDIQLLGGTDAPVEASYGDPLTPFYVALLLDTSGSMQNVMESVREAAQKAIDKAPPTAHFAVIPFNKLKIQEGEELHLAADFTNNLGLVQNTITRIKAEPNAPTCLYDATYKAVELLEQQVQSPQERRAIILFTDGKDEQLDPPGPCSFYGYENVIDKALPSNAPNTPIHTIGLCVDNTCSNLNRTELRDMARDTYAFSAFGEQKDIGDRFQEIINGLNSQFVAQANIFAQRGANKAALIVKLNDEVELTTTFHFFSNREYTKPALPVSAEITGVGYEAQQDIYTLSLSLISPESIHQVVVEVWDTAKGIQIGEPQIFDDPEATIQLERETTGFEDGGEYAFRVKALDEEGFLIKSEEGETILAESGIVYSPPQVEVVFAIQSVEVNLESGNLSLDLEVLDETQEFNKYEGFIVDKDTGQKVHSFGPELFPGKQIEETLPDNMIAAQASKSYHVTLSLITKSEQRLPAEPYEFTIIPPPQPSTFSRIMSALISPYVCIPSLIIILCVIVLFIYWRWPKKEKPLPKPYRTSAMDVVVPPSQLRLRLTVLKTPIALSEKEKIITNFPYTIGRQGCNFNISSPNISRRHAEITVQNEQLFLTDLRSSNGTFIGNQRLDPHQPRRLDSPTIVRLGSQTEIKLEM